MNLIPAPYRIIALVLLLLAGIAFGYVQGVTRESDKRDAQALEQVRAAQAAADRESSRREAVGAAREGSREKIWVVYRTIKEKANEYEQKIRAGYVEAGAPVSSAGCGLDADGLRLWNAANSGDASSLSGEPDYALPASVARQIGQLGGFIQQPHRGDGAGGAVPGSVGEAGGVREPSPVNGR